MGEVLASPATVETSERSVSEPMTVLQALKEATEGLALSEIEIGEIDFERKEDGGVAMHVMVGSNAIPDELERSEDWAQHIGDPVESEEMEEGQPVILPRRNGGNRKRDERYRLSLKVKLQETETLFKKVRSETGSVRREAPPVPKVVTDNKPKGRQDRLNQRAKSKIPRGQAKAKSAERAKGRRGSSKGKHGNK